jgi:putative nucleotidyltransferase with HDIG domain
VNGSKIPWRILEDIRAAGGKPMIVGGSVRDMVMHPENKAGCFLNPLQMQWQVLEDSKDIDIEVFGLSIDSLHAVLETHGTVDVVGKSFGVLKLHSRGDVDFSVPRVDNKVGVGHRGFNVDIRPDITYKDAARRRDLTMNSIGLDPFEMVIEDPFHGVADLRAGVLRATDPSTFLDDPLRALRVAQFVSRFHMVPDETLVDLCSKADLSQLPGERLLEEFNKLLLGRSPGAGLTFLHDSGLLRFFPELHALVGVQQDPVWHPEGWSTRLSAKPVSTDATTALPVKRITMSLPDLVSWLSAKATSTPSCTSMGKAKAITGHFSKAQGADVDNLTSKVVAPPAIVAKPVTLVGLTRYPAILADKGCGIVFEVSNTGMLSIVKGAIDDLHVVDRIVSSISINVMHMLSSKQFALEKELSDITVSVNPSAVEADTFVPTPVVVLLERSSIDDDKITVHINLHEQKNSIFVKQGDVFRHTVMAVDEARKLTDDLVVLWAVLLHDLGKPCTTELKDGRWKAHGHEQAGVEPARAFLGRLRASHELTSAVCALVNDHLAPATFYKAKAGPGAFRRLARRLGSVSLSTLETVSRADQWGRTTPDALARKFPAGEWFLEQAAKVGVQSKAEADVVQGRHLIERGMKPGPAFGPLLTACREYQYETGEKDPSKILDALST